MPERACVSISSVTKTLATESSCMSGCIVFPLASVQANTFLGVHGTHVGEDDFIAEFESVEDFDGVDGRATEFYGSAGRGFTVGIDAEEGYSAVRLAYRRATYIKDVVEAFDIHGSVDAEVGTRAFRQ